VLARGDKYAFGQMLDPFAKFVGIDTSATDRLSPEQLFEKQRLVFAAGMRFARQFPDDRFGEQVIPNRPRLIRTLCYHIFRIGEAFLETWDGAEYSTDIADGEPAESMKTGDDIARYGQSVWNRYDAWWADCSPEERTLSRMLKTYYGDTVAHRVYERVVWHSAQHCRQLVDVLGRMGTQPDRPLTPEDLAGLPVPERLFE
jgi:hypothetical protein